ncbi:TRAFs-binding domain-containing protein [Paenibacillus wynnii]|uniref:TRAFs-binding domain-containing protein n=1 Tax=Paenibacillus wynnii TaxID=268407 RepID=UPI002793AD5E|nr:TRAFs-binding domain-containing protein [Paenibacillus wynnii]MDQ0195830.1 tetratricopeptide (TPR) repeat protein [Paenibacillus wynnii]
MSKKICFVVMGYGVKTDYSTGRELDLDKTYQNIVKPAVTEAGLECIRADEIKHSGIIDVPMYQHLYTADVVIADLSTYNPNAFYELGIRHALKPHTTIAIAEKELKYPFDLNHTVIRPYEHLGKGIDYDEVNRFRKDLQETIESILSNPNIDSPVYTYLHELTPPVLSKALEIVTLPNPKESLSSFLNFAQEAINKNDFITAKSLFHTALTIDPNSSYIKQKIALATYKSKYPDVLSSLFAAYEILLTLDPEITTDPETLGLLGAVCKRLWESTNERAWLDKAIHSYEKGFYIKNDYYNGINFAFLLNVRGSISDRNDAIADYVLASRARLRVISICEALLESSFDTRGDKYWILATLEEAYFGINMHDKYTEIKKRAESAVTSDWERETTEEQIGKLAILLEKSLL